MEHVILVDLERRKKRIVDKYYKYFGQIIKKRRLELKLTQEYLAQSICSNTYISKAENNLVLLGQEQLNLIMERLNLSDLQYAKPETLVRYLENIIGYFYYRDIASYEKLIKKLEVHSFHVVVELIRLGYHVLIGDYHEGIKNYNHVLDYLNSMDDLAFEIFLVFSANLQIKLNNPTYARKLIESSFVIQSSYPRLVVLANYTKMICYGKLHIYHKSMRLMNDLLQHFMDDGNLTLLNEMMVLNALFKEYAGEKTYYENVDKLFQHCDQEIVDEYLMIKSINSYDGAKYVELINDKQSESYLIALYYVTLNKLINNDETYHGFMDKLSQAQAVIKPNVDYLNLIKLQKKKELMFAKDHLVNAFLKQEKEKQNIFLVKQITKQIVDILDIKNRYKDGLTYMKKLDIFIEKLQKQYVR